MKLGEKIKPVRIHRGLSQRELGDRLRLDGNVANRIAQYESGFRTPKESKNKETANSVECIWKIPAGCAERGTKL